MGLQDIDLVGVGERLEALRTAHGVTRTEFSGAVGLDVSSYAKIARGDMLLQIYHAWGLSRRYGASLEYIYAERLEDLRSDLLPKVKARLAEIRAESALKGKKKSR